MPAFVISRRFHATVVDMWAAMCAAVQAQHHIDRVVLGGG
jgi:hydrogenase maturation factor HypF (carbamoyltransferase family)